MLSTQCVKDNCMQHLKKRLNTLLGNAKDYAKRLNVLDSELQSLKDAGYLDEEYVREPGR